ncbi:hypothetical protein [Micromonospora peucetia]|uniref:Uncharacterized protein n=1 Tax=Micromonospora peucetia TaxID=47871 RepID=A0ABZ1ELH4_9ACTN|nr:hypothetical protein [Micromonospora peucetia]WSA35112.1 hypothetical protein OIE14_14240 [Micromonospora peucetia]
MWPFVGLALIPVVVVCLTAAALGDGALGASLARNAMFFVGAALLLLSTFGQSATVAVPIAYFFIVSLLGGSPGGSAEWWAVVRGPADPASVIAAVFLLIFASAIFRLRARQAAALLSCLTATVPSNPGSAGPQGRPWGLKSIRPCRDPRVTRGQPARLGVRPMTAHPADSARPAAWPGWRGKAPRTARGRSEC